VAVNEQLSLIGHLTLFTRFLSFTFTLFITLSACGLTCVYVSCLLMACNKEGVCLAASSSFTWASSTASSSTSSRGFGSFTTMTVSTIMRAVESAGASASSHGQTHIVSCACCVSATVSSTLNTPALISTRTAAPVRSPRARMSSGCIIAEAGTPCHGGSKGTSLRLEKIGGEEAISFC